MDRRVAQTAERQHGVFALRQATGWGFTSAAVQHRLRTGQWELVRPGVYRLPGSHRTWEQRLMAVTLAAGPDAVASHRSAAALLNLPGFGRLGSLEVTTPRAAKRRYPHATMHRSSWLPASHLSAVGGIPCTRIARTLVDLAGVLPPVRTERAIDNCLAAGQVSTQALTAVAAELARPGRPGTALLGRLLEERSEGYVAPAGELEARFLALVRSAGLPEPVRQHDVGDAQGWAGRVDFAYPDLRLLIELDSHRHHMSKLDFEADRARDNRRVAAGWRPVRFTWAVVTGRPMDVVEVLRHSGVIPHRQGDVGSPRLVG